ncbi:MAG TPA: carboxypeptidase-like regulatory domain-containing protein [Polyangiaceae bacterium]|nr:carboxypeptidase-like regulatory domain-containing protein [Polyangiaceae bacterium]
MRREPLRWFALVLASALAACGRVQRDAPTPLPTDVSAGGTASGAEPDPPAEGGSDADAESNAGITITGKLIDSWRQPAAGCQVALGSATAVTDSRGQFRFEHVRPPYDIAFEVPGVTSPPLSPELWLYHGLTRADPTLQFDRVLVNQATLLSVEQTNTPTQAAESGAAKLRLGMSFAAPGVELGASDLTSVDEFGRFILSAQWSGETSISGTVHSLAWQSPSGDPAGLDLEFLSYQERPFTLSDDPSFGPLAQVTLDFSPSRVASETYPVTIQGDLDNSTTLGSAIVFDSNAAIWLTERKNPGALSNVAMPVLAGGHALFSASRIGSASAFALVHRRADSSASITTLTIPTPRTLTTPNDGADGVTESTRFAWSDGGSDGANVSMLHIHSWKRELDVHVVTAESSATWPSVPALPSSFPKDGSFGWGVEVHGAFATVDDAAGPNGFLVACGAVSNCSRGPRLDDGSLTQSSWRNIASAP